jgi:pantetheine-phosphate adenylyltransferase
VKHFDPNDEDMVWLHKNDLACFRSNSRKPVNIAQNELNIFREYQFVSFDTFLSNRLPLLNYYKKHPLVSKPLIESIIDYLSIWEPNVGLFVGSFDPFHRGHQDILHQAEKVFDKVIVAQGQNEEKGQHLYDISELPALKYHEKFSYSGSLIDFVKLMQTRYKRITIVRGLRNYHDLHDESGLFNFVSDYSKVPFAYFISKSENLHISSGAIRKLLKLNQNVEKYLP